MTEHFSERFDRTYQDNDLLDKYEAVAVLVANSHHPISPEYLSKLRQRGRVIGVNFKDAAHPERVTREFYYQYAQLRDMVISTEPGPPRSSESSNAQRQREWRQRQKGKGQSREKRLKKAG